MEADYWKNRIIEHQKQRTATIEIAQDIQEAMINYLKSVGKSEEFTLAYHEFGEVELHCNGDLFDLEQIGGFCDVFGLQIMISNRLVAEDYMTDSTNINTNYLFTTSDFKKQNKEELS